MARQHNAGARPGGAALGGIPNALGKGTGAVERDAIPDPLSIYPTPGRLANEFRQAHWPLVVAVSVVIDHWRQWDLVLMEFRVRGEVLPVGVLAAVRAAVGIRQDI